MGFDWLSGITDSLGSAFDKVTESSIWDSPSFTGGLINAGVGLASQWASQGQAKDTAEAYAQQQQIQNQIEQDRWEREFAFRKEQAAKGGGGGGSAVKAAEITAEANRKNALANLYQNWAALNQKAASDMAGTVQGTGALIGRSLDARQANMK